VLPSGLLTSGAIVAGIVIVVLIGGFLLFKKVLKMIFGIVINSIIGLITLFLLANYTSFGIPINLASIIPTAVFGLPGIATLVIFKLLGG
jgi:pro-sigmaK processing inhibitor BofA